MQVVLSVGVAGFELATPCSQSRYTNRTVLHPESFFSKRGCKSTILSRYYQNFSAFFNR